MVLAFAAFPENGANLSKNEYATISLANTVLAAIAPAIYNLFRKPEDDPSKPTGVQYQGYVLLFALAAGITVWAAMGQTSTLALAIDDLRRSGTMPGWLARPLVVLLAASTIGLAVYGAATAIFTVKKQANQRTALLTGKAVGNPLLPKWSVL